MAKPYFSGDYGSALAQIDTRPIMQGAAAQAAMYQNLGQSLGQSIGGAIEKYQLNKVKRAKLTGDIEAYLKENPDYINESTMTGDEAADKKNMTQFEKFHAGDLNMAGLEGLAGKLARGDTLRKNRLLEESQITANKMQGLTLGIAKQLEETKVNTGINAGILSDLYTKREVEQDPKKREVYNAQIRETLANLKMGKLGRDVTTARLEGELETMPAEIKARKVTAEAVPGQVESATAARKRADDTAKALLEAMGGAEGAAAMTVEEKNLSMNKIQSYINYMDRQGQASVLKALVGTAPPSVTKQAATLSAFQGDLLGYKVRDPINGGQISFEKYLELNNQEPGLYPLTGDNAGTAGRINATFLNSQKQIDDLVKTVEVQAVVPGAVGGTGGGAGDPLPSVIKYDMTQEQADAATAARITEIRTLIHDLNTEFANLGTPGQTMTVTPVAFGPGGFAPGAPPASVEQPQTVGHRRQREQQIPAKIAALRAELTQLANL